MKDEQIKLRVTETTKRDFKNQLEKNAQYMSGVLLLFIDAYIKNPKQTVESLQRIRK
jgi:hypothetical protein